MEKLSYSIVEVVQMDIENQDIREQQDIIWD